MRGCVWLGLLLALAVGCLIAATCPPGADPPHYPPTSTAAGVPPWPLFYIVVALNNFFETMAAATRPPLSQVLSLSSAYWQSDVAYALTLHGVFDLIGTGSMSCVEVSKRLSLHEPFTCRMMRAGEAIGLLVPHEKAYSLSPAGDLLRSEHPHSMRAFMLMINEESREAFRTAGTKSLKSGVSGFKERYGEEFWEFHSKHPKQMTQFDNAMKSLSHFVVGSLLRDWTPPAPDAFVCDVGGGIGEMVLSMATHYPQLKGLTFDLPPVAANAAKFFASRGVESRLSAVGGSFLETLPAQLKKCDVFYMKFVLHDWSDSDCVKILKNVKAAAKPGSKIVSTDFILGLDGSAMEKTKKLMDINMMGSCPSGGRERTVEEYMNLYLEAGLPRPTLIKMRDVVSSVEVTVP
ncbi:hypothetical protein AB1Y20_009594 [Prymnesium parvum]|uniref:O-methyltransferase C-terminal domain-containing protein n=1 Tax=Prymnesium parvum TaxID=97485 RepID=A0AB34K5E3_PRYPA